MESLQGWWTRLAATPKPDPQTTSGAESRALSGPCTHRHGVDLGNELHQSRFELRRLRACLRQGDEPIERTAAIWRGAPRDAPERRSWSGPSAEEGERGRSKDPPRESRGIACPTRRKYVPGSKLVRSKDPRSTVIRASTKGLALKPDPNWRAAYDEPRSIGSAAGSSIWMVSVAFPISDGVPRINVSRNDSPSSSSLSAKSAPSRPALFPAICGTDLGSTRLGFAAPP